VFLQLNMSLRITEKSHHSPGFPAPTGTQRARPGRNGMYTSVGCDVVDGGVVLVLVAFR
jgi:hypothetical protein